MDFNGRLNKIEDKIEVSGKKVIHISTVKDLILFVNKQIPVDTETEVVCDEKIVEIIENTIGRIDKRAV